MYFMKSLNQIVLTSENIPSHLDTQQWQDTREEVYIQQLQGYKYPDISNAFYTTVLYVCTISENLSCK